MVKTANKAPKAPAAAPTATAPVKVPTKPNLPGVLQVKAGLTFRGARQAWYNVLVAHNGQPANAYLAATLATPPSLPKSQRADAPTGWLRYFVRTGACTVVQPTA